MWRGISLANKCLYLMGGAILASILAALVVNFLRMNRLVDEGQHEHSRQLASIWIRLDREAGVAKAAQPPAQADARHDTPPDAPMTEHAGIRARRLSLEQARHEAKTNDFIRRALEHFEGDATADELADATWVGVQREYRYALAEREFLSVPASDEAPEKRLAGLIALERRSLDATRLLTLNSAFLLSTGSFVVIASMLGFYFILHKLILAPVRDLRETAERVREGDLATRAAISTGDEFEELGDTFNAMLGDLQRNQDQLRSINRAMDLKLNELAESNVALAEAAKLKGDFLANVSHELRTPLNSIIGFAELLREGAQSEIDAGDDSTRLQKRVKYLDNIANAGRNLMTLINDLLEMAKIEAGKAMVRPERVNITDTCETLVGLLHPQASAKGLSIHPELAPHLPLIETDSGKLRQILFNLLSNAVKFTPAIARDGQPGRITLRAELLPAGAGDPRDRVRFSVIDTGPGIAKDDQARIFEKFQQLDGGRTREHAGTGLGLAISRELAHLLQGEIHLESDLGRGSMFSLILPTKLDEDRLAEAKLEAQFRGSLASRRIWSTAKAGT